MAARSLVNTPAVLAGLFVLVTGIPLAGLGWLGQRVLSQQADLEHERLQGQLENSATVLGRELDRGLAGWESIAAAALAPGIRPATRPPGGTALLLLDGRGVMRADGVRLPYYPALSGREPDHRQVFAAAHAAEFLKRDFVVAAAAYQALSTSADRPIRAAALLGLARCLKATGQTAEALHTLTRLEALADTTVAGAPAEFVAHRENLVIFQAANDRDKAQQERDWLSLALSEGRLTIDRATYDEFSATLGLAPAPTPSMLALSEAAADLSPDWQRRPDGRAVVTRDTRPIISVWRREGEATAVVIGPMEVVASALVPMASDLHVTFGLDDPGGALVWGTPPADRPVGTHSLREAGLPWTMRVSAVEQTSTSWVTRQGWFVFAFGFLALVVAGASYAVFRSVSRELEVARLQSDFVSAVSHEFRTPLTAIRHFTSMLEEGTAEPSQVPTYYQVLGKESRRLHDLVENILNFGRLESGERVHVFSDFDATHLARDVVQDISERVTPNAREVRLTAPDAALPIRADREAVMLALRNLIDNAVKYSPGAAHVDVSVQPDDGHVAIAVSDRGIGVPVDEQRAIFRKFVRGSSARSLMIKGTGIGLAMADRIVRAHGGTITLTSEPGAGSTFTIRLPMISHA
jgi:signal transduction histidine kinase